MKMLTHRGVLVEDMGQTCLAEPDGDGEKARTLRPLQAAAITYRIAFGPHAGRKMLSLRGAMPRRASWARLLKRVFHIDVQRCPSCGRGD